MSDHMNEDYLNLFRNIQENKGEEEMKPLNETPNYDNLNSLNETPDVSQYQIQENVNDGWDPNYVQFETRVNGIIQQPNQTQQPVRKKRDNLDLNGLNQFLEEDNLNEVVRHQQTKQLTGPQTTEGFKEVEVVSVEMFERMSQQALLPLGQKSHQLFNTYR